MSKGQGWACARQHCDLNVWYLGEETDGGDFDSKKEELCGEAEMRLCRPFS